MFSVDDVGRWTAKRPAYEYCAPFFVSFSSFFSMPDPGTNGNSANAFVGLKTIGLKPRKSVTCAISMRAIPPMLSPSCSSYNFPMPQRDRAPSDHERTEFFEFLFFLSEGHTFLRGHIGHIGHKTLVIFVFILLSTL